MGFGLVIWFIGQLQNVTTNNYNILTELHTPKINVTTAHIKSSQSSLTVARSRLPMADVPLTMGSRTVPMSQLPASNSNRSQGLNRSNPLSNSLTNQLTPLHSLTPMLAAISHQPPALLPSQDSRNCSRSSLYNLCTDRTENIYPNSSIIASRSYRTRTA
jgi:hypothetical protein